VNARVDHFTGNWHLLLDKKPFKQLPVGELALQRDCVVIGMHLNVETKVSREYLGHQKAVAEVALGVLHGVGEVKGLDPLEDFARET
jgi:hypothetical protein